MVEKKSTTDWRTDLLDDNNFEQKTEFNYELCVTLLEDCGKDLENLNPFLLLRPIWEITKAFRALSSALSVGFADITDKVNVWRSLIKDHYKEANSIQEVIEKEVSLSLHELNGENNGDKKYGHKKKTTYYEYVSGTRTLLRLSWFLDFFNNIVKNCNEQADKSFSDCIKISYDKCLAPHHPWLVRKGAAIGISFAPSKREKAMKLFFGEEAWNDDCKKKMERWRLAIEKIWTYINGLYEKKQFLELP